MTDQPALFRVVDIETTGMTPPHAEVIEIGWQDVVHDGTQAIISGPTLSCLHSSLRPSPPEVLAVHHILPEDCCDFPLFDQAQAHVTMEMIGGRADYWVAHNSGFETSFLPELMSGSVICTYKCALHLWPDAPSHSNQSLMYWLGGHLVLDVERRHPPHRAGPDAYVTAYLLARLLEAVEPAQLVQWTAEPRLLPTCPLGKHKGQLWSLIPHSYLQWITRQTDMDADVVWAAQQEIQRRRTAILSGD